MLSTAEEACRKARQFFTRHGTDEIIYPDEGYLGCTYTPDLIVIQITWVGGRFTQVKQQFYLRIANEILEKAYPSGDDRLAGLCLKVMLHS